MSSTNGKTALRKAREKSGLTRQELAHRIGCSYAQLANLELGLAPKESAVRDRAWEELESLKDRA